MGISIPIDVSAEMDKPWLIMDEWAIFEPS